VNGADPEGLVSDRNERAPPSPYLTTPVAAFEAIADDYPVFRPVFRIDPDAST